MLAAVACVRSIFIAIPIDTVIKEGPIPEFPPKIVGKLDVANLLDLEGRYNNNL